MSQVIAAGAVPVLNGQSSLRLPLFTMVTNMNTSETYNEACKYVKEFGWSVIPITHKDKKPKAGFLPKDGAGRPSWTKYQAEVPNESDLLKWFGNGSASNVGVVTGKVSGIIVVDADSKEAAENLERKGLPRTPTVVTGKGKHYYFRYPHGFDAANKVRIMDGVDIRAEGGYVVAPPSIHSSGRTYCWEISPDDQPLAELPEWLRRALTTPDSGAMHSKPSKGRLRTLADCIVAVRDSVEGERNHTLNRSAYVAGTLVSEGATDEDDAANALAEAGIEAGLPPTEVFRTIKSAMEAGERDGKKKGKLKLRAHLALAELTATQHDNICCAQRGWMQYEDGIWVPCDVRKVSAYIIDTLKGQFGPNGPITNSMVASIRSLMECDPHLGVDDAIFDAQQSKLVFGNGVLDVDTDEFTSHDKGLYSTYRLPYDYNPQARAENWREYLNTLDPEVVLVLQEFVGYALTADTSRETAMWLVGPPRSGKSTFVEGVKAALQGMVGVLGLEHLNNQFSLGGITNRTLLIATEQPADYIRCTHLLNSLISGETLRIEQKYKDPFLYTPYAKILWAMNERPRLHDSNNGLFRRVKIVPFEAIAAEQCDIQLKERIKGEGQGIILWALEGLKRLRTNDCFTDAKAITQATEDFRSENDIVAVFVEETCIRTEYGRISASQLYRAYNEWCRDNGYKPMASNNVAKDWRRLGFQQQHTSEGNFWLGVKPRG